MKYRWGFDVSGVFTECKPIVEDSTSLDFAPQSGEVFYRAKLNGSLTFRFESFDSLIAAGYNVEHQIVLQYYDNSLSDWAECWRGRFTLTDCEIDYDTNTISVQPETLDRYTKILDHIDDEYNVVKLAVPARPVTINIRPCLQMYCSGDGKITNYVGESFWEASCDTITDPTELADTYHFAKLGEVLAMGFTLKETWFGETTYKKIIAYTNNTERDESHNIYLTGSDGVTYRCSVWQNGTERRYTIWYGNGADDWLFEAYYDGYGLDHIYDNPLATYDIHSFCQWSVIHSRILLQTELASISLLDTTLTTYDVPNNDMSGSVNLNYNKVAPCTTACVHFVSSVTVQSAPTEYGVSYSDEYFVRYTESGYNPLPVAPTQWFLCSLWVYPYYRYRNYIDNYSAERTIKDSYLLRDVCTRLLQKAGWSGEYFISRAFNGNNDYVGDAFVPVITPKSNVISSYYDMPAQKAPITLRKILSMLKEVYKSYWYIDGNGNIHVEHISFYDNGYSYSDADPQLLVDLETTMHTNTKENKVFGQNKITYEKGEMPQHFTFGWMDDQTLPFYGYPIKCLDNYVQKGVKEEYNISSFDADVDYILGSPDEVSKDGFVLFACPVSGGYVYYKLSIENVAAKDEDGITVNYRIQNPNGAFIKIHQSWWRYALPCENINVNNQDTTAVTTGRYKLQNVEFADEVMAELLADIDNCNKVIRTQQGDGKIKTLSVNLNSLTAKGDLLFNFVGRWYYLRGTALGASIVINVNNEPITIEVSDNKWRLKYAEPMTALDFNGADIVSVDFSDCDKLESLTSADGMFENCAELLAVDFGGKKLAAVTSAVDMFAGCAQLTTLICPQTSTWKPDLSFADCPDLTTESVYSLIGFLYDYDAGVHTIDFNSTMWDALDADTQTDITTKAGAKGWTIGTATVYYINGQSTASTVYATINGTPVEIQVENGAFSYAYNAPITSLSFENDANVTVIDFSLSDGLAGVTSLADAFKGCAGLTTLVFTNCDLTNVASASDCFAGCSALYSLSVPAGTWKPDVDLSDTAMVYSDMLSTIGMLYTYATGTHTITFNQTTWDSLSVAQQQTIFDAAQLKGWTTNAVMVIYLIKGKSTAASESFTLQFIDDLQTITTETITCAVDGNGDFEYQYFGKRIYSLNRFLYQNTTCTAIEFTEDMAECTDLIYFALNNTTITSAIFTNATFAKVTTMQQAFGNTTNLATLTISNATFESVTSARFAFQNCGCTNLQLDSATFESLTDATKMFDGLLSTTLTFGAGLDFSSITAQAENVQGMFSNMPNVSELDLSGQTFANIGNIDFMFRNTKAITIKLPNATFTSATTARYLFDGCSSAATIDIKTATFASVTNATYMFHGCSNLTSLDITNVAFNAVTNTSYMFQGCAKLTTLDLSNCAFASVTNAAYMFQGCSKITTLDLSTATFAMALDIQHMFDACNAMTALDLTSATFAATTNARQMFSPVNSMQTINMPSATFAALQNGFAMFSQYAPPTGKLTSILMPNAEFGSLLGSGNNWNIFNAPSGAQGVTTLTVASGTLRVTMSVAGMPLSYQSILNVANWCADLTGQTAQTITFKTSAWNALSSAEQATIQGILQGKNWTLATA